MKRFFKDGETVLFQGDSVTDCGRPRDYDNKNFSSRDLLGPGYPVKVYDIYKALFPDNKVNFINRAVSGDKISDVLKRYDKDTKEVKPDFLSLMIGINDTWHFQDNNIEEPADVFSRLYEKYLIKVKSDFPRIKILIIDAFYFTDWQGREGWYKDFIEKHNSTHKIAEKYADYHIDMFDIMTHQTDFEKEILSQDGVHPKDTGHSLIASEIVKTLKII